MYLNKKNQLKIAFVGGALNSAVGNAHYAATSLDNNFELVAGCFSRHKDVNNFSGNQYGVADDRVYDSLNELLYKEKDRINAIVILTPTDQHSHQVIECINAGIPVICEKALALNVKEASDIKLSLQKNDGFLAVIYNYLGYPMLREAKNIINQGVIGKVQHIKIEMPQEGFKRISTNGAPIIPQNWRLHDGIIPTISLDLGVHLHMMIKYLTGEIPVNVIASSKTLGNFPEIIDNVSCMIEYTNNMTCDMWYSKVAIGKRNGLAIIIYGENGSIEWIQEKPEDLHLADNKGNKWSLDRGSNGVTISNQPRYTRFKAGHPAGFIEAFANYYFDIATSIEQFMVKKKQFMNSECFGIDESIEGLNLFEAISKSSQKKTWERINNTVIN